MKAFWDLVFYLNFNIYLVIFPNGFLCSKHFIFLHLSYHIYPIYRILFCEENWFVVFVSAKVVCGLWDHQDCNPIFCFGFVPFPLSVEVIVVVPYLLCRGCVCWREELCTPSLYYPNPQWRFPVWEVLCGQYSENPSVWRRGRRAVTRTSKHILVFAFDPLSLNFLSLILCLALFHIVHIILICLVLFVCHTCVQPRELQIAPQLLFRGI